MQAMKGFSGGGGKLLKAIKSGFTLAEVLITLGIIGVVASMTIPSVVASYKEKETVAKLKKVYNLLSQALAQTINEQEQTVDFWPLEGEDSPNGSEFLIDNYIKPHIKILNDCKDRDSCIGDKKYKYLNGREHISYNMQSRYRHLVFSDGTLLILHVSPQYTTCSSLPKNCAEIFIDVDGYFRGPNQFGRDFFVFSLMKDRIVPYGTLVNKPNEYSLCADGYGVGCAELVLRYENMDYLHKR